MDWNWFFSSLAQSVAALVGIFAAFIITKVINNQGEFARKLTRLKELLSSSERYIEALRGRYFSWYSKHTLNDALDSLKGKLDKESKQRTAEEYYGELNVPLYIPRAKVIKKIDEIIRTYSRGSSSAGSYSPLFTREMIRDKYERERRLSDKVEEEGNQIDALIINVKQHIRLVKLHLSEVETHPESSELVSYSIVAALLLFFVGVIYPLSFLPVDTAKPITLSVAAFFDILFSLKGFMLITASAIFSLIMGIFWRVNSSLKYPKEDLEKLRNATEIKNYSDHLGVMEANINEQKEWYDKLQAKKDANPPDA